MNHAVIAYGAPQVEDPARIGEVSAPALGLDETPFCRQRKWRSKAWCTSIVDVSAVHTQLLDVVPGRSARGPSRWLEARPREWRGAIRHRGRKDDPLCRARRRLTKGHERLDERGETKLLGLPAAGDPRGEVRMAWHPTEVVRSIHEINDAKLAGHFVDQLGHDLQDEWHRTALRVVRRCWWPLSRQVGNIV